MKWGYLKIEPPLPNCSQHPWLDHLRCLKSAPCPHTKDPSHKARTTNEPWSHNANTFPRNTWHVPWTMSVVYMLANLLLGRVGIPWRYADVARDIEKMPKSCHSAFCKRIMLKCHVSADWILSWPASWSNPMTNVRCLECGWQVVLAIALQLST